MFLLYCNRTFGENLMAVKQRPTLALRAIFNATEHARRLEVSKDEWRDSKATIWWAQAHMCFGERFVLCSCYGNLDVGGLRSLRLSVCRKYNLFKAAYSKRLGGLPAAAMRGNTHSNSKSRKSSPEVLRICACNVPATAPKPPCVIWNHGHVGLARLIAISEFSQACIEIEIWATSWSPRCSEANAHKIVHCENQRTWTSNARVKSLKEEIGTLQGAKHMFLEDMQTVFGQKITVSRFSTLILFRLSVWYPWTVHRVGDTETMEIVFFLIRFTYYLKTLC